MSPSLNESQCLVCARAKTRTISIAGSSLCSECEALIVSMDVNDSAYDQVVQRLRLFWGGLAEAAASHE